MRIQIWSGLFLLVLSFISAFVVGWRLAAKKEVSFDWLSLVFPAALIAFLVGLLCLSEGFVKVFFVLEQIHNNK